MIADTTRAKNTWTEMTTKMKTTEAEISSEIKKNIATIKEKEKAIDSLHRKMNNPMNSSFSSKYQKEISDIDKSIAAYKRYNKELENTAKTERMMSYKQMGGNVAGAA